MKTNEHVVSINKVLFDLRKGEDAKISVFDRGLLFGDSVYEVTRTYRKIPFLFEEHLDRLWRSAEQIYMPIQYSRQEIYDECQKLIDSFDNQEVYLRIMVTRGEGAIGLDPDLAGTNNLIIFARIQEENPKWWYEKGVNMAITDIIRNPKKATDPNIKSGNYLNNMLAYIKAKKKGAFDAIMLNNEGLVTEGTTSNIWMVKQGKLFTPPVGVGILEGITRKKVLEICKENKIEAIEKNFHKDELIAADEAFLTSSTKEIVPITQVDAVNIKDGVPGKLTMRLMDLYRQLL
ncbi:MAG: aminotransferase class IV [Halobacteriovoraceae bacterium]|nr:aminotransferase class IV [Halobacteriovoraceae bacterium]